MHYLVTGITGFAGPHLAKLLLREGHDVYGLIRGSNGRQMDMLDVMTEKEIDAVHWLFADLLDYPALESLVRQYPFDGVFHLAAQSHPPTSFAQPVLTFNTNVMGSANLIDCIEKHLPECVFHFCSTSEVYGDQPSILTESSAIQPVNPYGVTKAAIDLYVQERVRNSKIKAFITRAFSHTGPRRGHRFSISSDAFQIARMILGLQDRDLLVGNLKTQRQVMDVRDCVRAYYLLMQYNQQHADLPEVVFNVSHPASRPMQFFTDTLVELSGLDDVRQVIHPPFWRPIDIQVQQSDTRRLKAAVDWEPEIDIRQTLGDLLAYWVAKLRKTVEEYRL